MTGIYSLVDSGNGSKLERFGEVLIQRPCSQAVWKPMLPEKIWRTADASFTRDDENQWTLNKELPKKWTISVDGITFTISITDFGHVGIFPEQRDLWRWIRDTIKGAGKSVNVLNTFAYSGGSTLAAALEGSSVCHLDASKGMVSWARENASINKLDNVPIRWIVDDVKKFLTREVRRKNRYDGIILDPPTFGRGNRGEVFKIEYDLLPILKQCRELLVPDPLFLLLSCHTPGYTPRVLANVMEQLMKGFSGTIEYGEMCLTGEDGVMPVPSGTYVRWRRKV